MIHSDPTITSMTISTPNASARTLLALSGPVVMWRKKTRCTPICAIASTTSAIGMLGPQTSDRPGNEERHDGDQGRERQPDQIAEHPFGDLAAAGPLVAGSGIAGVECRCWSVSLIAPLPSDRPP